MRYGFGCSACGYEQELSCAWAERPNVLPCPECGGTAEPLITGGSVSYVRNRPMRYDHKHTIPNMGWSVGRTDEQQDRLYGKIVRGAKKRAAEHRRGANKKDDFYCEPVGKMPLEIAEYITESTGDKNALMRDPETWLKKTECWTGE